MILEKLKLQLPLLWLKESKAPPNLPKGKELQSATDNIPSFRPQRSERRNLWICNSHRATYSIFKEFSTTIEMTMCLELGIGHC